MQIRAIETPALGDRSYVAIAGDVAAVIDPQRDIDRLEAQLDALGVRLTHVFETHVHNDYLSGGLELAERHGATYVLPHGAAAQFPCEQARAGDVYEVGSARLQVVQTPGHTPEHVSYVLLHRHVARAVFTGGSMLYGTVGRTDLLGSSKTEQLTRLQFRSVRRLGDELPRAAAVYPTHGFGSFCASSPSSLVDESTIGRERETNIAFRCDDEHVFASALLAGPRDRPRYYDRMADINLAGPRPIDLSPIEELSADVVAERVRSGQAVVDLRSREDFAREHLRGVLAIEGGDQFATYLGWLIPFGAPVTILAETREKAERAKRDAARIGFDRLACAIVGGPEWWAAAGAPRSYERATFEDLADRSSDTSARRVLDVRRDDEWEAAHVRDALHIPLHELTDRIGEVPDEEIWVHCATGFRASVAASILDGASRRVVLIDDDWANAQKQPKIQLTGHGV